MKKNLMMMIAALVATIAFVPNVFAAGGEITYGKVEDCTADDVLAKEGGKKAEGVISLAKEGSYENVVATYNGLVVKKIGAGTEPHEANRPDNYSWVGVKIAEPTGIEDFQNAVWYYNGQNQGKFEKDAGTDNYTIFVPINEALLEEAAMGKDGYLTYETAIDWNGEAAEGGVQKITFKISSKDITLFEKDKEDGTAGDLTWDEEKYETVVEAAKQPEESVKPDAPKAEEVAEEANPDTSDINIAFLIGMIVLGGCGTVYTAKRRLNK